MNAIVAVDQHWGIGAGNQLLFRLHLDMRHFVAHTKGKIVLMGYNTLLSFPGGRPLTDRVNIVLAPKDVQRTDCTVVHSVAELAEAVAPYNTDDVYVIGGAMFYRTMLPYCKQVYVTKVDAARADADAFFENLDELANWHCTAQSDPIDDNGYTIRFCTYTNKVPLAL